MTSDKIIKGLVKCLYNYRLGFLFLAPLGKRRVVIVIVIIAVLLRQRLKGVDAVWGEHTHFLRAI